MNFNNKKREVDGILFINKHKNVTSNYIIQRIKYIFQAKKIGHSGTLDPIATGILPVFLGKATKLVKYFINSDKKYCVIAKLGERTSTSDLTGKIIKKKSFKIKKKKIKLALKNFYGEINQIPPMYSAIKFHGIPLYKYARNGITVFRKSRKVTIYKLKLVFYVKNLIQLNICCSKGTYIRSLIDDLGKRLKCGAHVVALHRYKIDYPLDFNLIRLEKLLKLKKKYIFKEIDKLLIPIEKIF